MTDDLRGTTSNGSLATESSKVTKDRMGRGRSGCSDPAVLAATSLHLRSPDARQPTSVPPSPAQPRPGWRRCCAAAASQAWREARWTASSSDSSRHSPPRPCASSTPCMRAAAISTPAKAAATPGRLPNPSAGRPRNGRAGDVHLLFVYVFGGAIPHARHVLPGPPHAGHPRAGDAVRWRCRVMSGSGATTP